MADTATLSYENNYTVFRYNGHVIGLCPYSLEYYTEVGTEAILLLWRNISVTKPKRSI